MTSFGSSEKSEETCPSCGGPLTWRPAHQYPVGLTLAFGVCFVSFLFFSEKIAQQYGKQWTWIWSGIGVVLGVLLMKARLRAKRTILRCIRCDQALR